MRIAGSFFVRVLVLVIVMPVPAAAIDIFQATQDGSMLVSVLVAHDLVEFCVMRIAMAFHVGVMMVIFVFVGMLVIVFVGMLVFIFVSVIIVVFVGMLIFVIVGMLVIVIMGMLVFVIMGMLIFVFVGMLVIVIMGMLVIVIMGMLIVVIVGMLIVVFVSVLIVVFVSVIIVVFVSVIIVVFVSVIIVLMRVLIIFMHVAACANGNDLDASRDFHDRRIFRRAFDHVEQGFFNASAIDEDQIGFRQHSQLARAGLKSVRVGADWNQRRQFNAISRNVVDDIRKNTVGSDHFELVFLRDRADIGQHKGRQQA